MSVRVGVDVGGTFTDVVVVDDGRVRTAKVPSTPSDQSTGVMRALEAAGIEAGRVDVLAHGTTVATNALVERRGARIALVTTHGFRDVVEIGRQDRPSLYDLAVRRPPPLVPRDLRFTVRERMAPEGVVEDLSERDVVAVADALRAGDVEAVAVCLLFSFLHPAHERRVGDALRAALPDVRVSLSADVLPRMREYERLATTAADAYLGPGLERYLGNLARRTREAGFPAPLVMQSSGGVIPLADAGRHAAACVLSGPAGGAVGAAGAAAASGCGDALAFDMGGTSTDVAAIVGGRVRSTTEATVAGVPIGLPMVDVHSIGAGGGSVAWVDSGGALRVGPRSAGAEPGPASYGRGGVEPTVTDASVALGWLADGARLGDEVTLSRRAAEDALGALGRGLGLDVTQTALGVTRVAHAEMGRALRVVSVERGLDPRSFALVAFGGAGPMHACALADELGIRRVLVPRASGVLSALGLATSSLRRDYVRALPRVDARDEARVGAALDEIERRARDGLDGAAVERLADVRYRGQAFELTVPAARVERVVEEFHDAHERRYGHRVDDHPVEVVAVRAVATAAGAAAAAAAPGADAPARPPSRRRVCFEGAWADALVLAGAARGARVEGPAIVELAESTCVVPPAWRGAVDDAGALVLERA
ncbi:MAG TPA: hydantoinase/oxoprolinase family protein [Actinomycetota bacterium]|nr:hydantoinase/oxoprolinase family protein [Actinomycetota bacterium]